MIACSVVFNPDEDENLNSLWKKCTKCAYWAHARCHNIFYPSAEIGGKALEKWCKSNFLCQKHMN